MHTIKKVKAVTGKCVVIVLGDLLRLVPETAQSLSHVLAIGPGFARLDALFGAGVRVRWPTTVGAGKNQDRYATVIAFCLLLKDADFRQSVGELWGKGFFGRAMRG